MSQCPYILPERGAYRWLNCQLEEGHDGFCQTHFDSHYGVPQSVHDERRWVLPRDYCCPACRRPAEERR